MRHVPLRFIAMRGKSPALPFRRYIFHIVALCFLVAVTWAEFGHVQVHAISFDHTNPTVNVNCQKLNFSSDGNPFPLCPGPNPGGGNCVWWAWEQWRLLGYNLPLNWGNAADWIVDAERFGLPLGTKPRLGSIAVFPVADGVWAFGTAGHVAFVTGVSSDQSTFDVTYQNYGDPTPMFVGKGYPVSLINQTRYQNGQLRFIYFPGTIDPGRFLRLRGVNGNGVSAAQVARANSQINTDINTGTTSRVSLGLPPGSYDQQFNADFTGAGLTDLLLYNRQKGSLDVLTFSTRLDQITPHSVPYGGQRQPVYTAALPQRASLGDSITPVNGWGSTLDIQIGDFTGSGRSEILLYDRVSGKVQLLSLTPQLKIAKHVTLPGWGAGWEVYVGQFDGQHSDLFLYNRVVVPDPTFQPVPTTTPTTIPTTSPSPTKTPKPTPSPTKTPGPRPSPSPTVSPSPDPSPTKTPSPTPSPSPSPTETPSPSPTAKPSPTNTSNTGAKALFSANAPLDTPQKPGPGGDLSGSASVDTQNLGLFPNVALVSFKSDFSINQQQEYTLMHDSWEVYIGRFDSANQDGLFLYDRTAGEARILDFSSKLLVHHYQVVRSLDGNWDIHTGDFNGSGRAQVLLYDPGTGNAQFLAFAPDLSLATQVDDPALLPGQVLYIGHFGLPSLSVMLFDPVAERSTFYAFDTSLRIANQYTAQSWTQHWQVLIGSFLDRSTCIANHTCAAGDDVLALNRQTGQVQQFIFTFGNQYHVFDNRSQSFLRDGVASTPEMATVDASSFVPQTILNTGIINDELY
jgi:CHAP domain